MLAHLEPSVELTGGPWYTDNELDTEFIKLLSTACLHYIRDRVRRLFTLGTHRLILFCRSHSPNNLARHRANTDSTP